MLTSRRRRQAGASTLELLIAMAVTGSIMTALVGVVYAANVAVARWQQPLAAASSRPMFEVLATNLETDARVLQACRVSSVEIDLGDGGCQPPYAVTYVLSGNDIVRVSAAGRQGVTHRLANPPQFASSCQVQDSVHVGTISVRNLNYGVRLPDLVVGFTGPAGLC